ncbi:unnamed protein product, partial [Brassica rapa]
MSVQYTQDVCGCPPRSWLSISTHRTSVCVHVCPSAHTGRPWLSISTHISTLVLGISKLALPVDCSGDFGPRGLSVQYTQDVCECPSAHTGRPCDSVSTHRTSVAVCVCLCVSDSTHMMSVAVQQYTYQHVGPWTQHADPSRGLFGTDMTSVGVRQHTQDVRGCLCESVCVRLCPSAHTGRPWLSISTHISMLVLGLSTLALPVDCLGDFGPRGLSVQYTNNVRGCPPAHTGRPWLSWVSASTHRTAVAVHGCPSAHTGRPWLSVCVCVCPAAHTGRPQHTQDVRVCPSAHTGNPCVSVSTHRTSVAVRVCPCVSVSTHRTSLAVNQYTYQHVGSWTQHADPS